MHTELISPPFSTGLGKLTQFALISASGVDATKFLHSQFTNDITSLPENHACLAGYCSTKGRLLADLLVWKSAQSDESAMTALSPNLSPASGREGQSESLRDFYVNESIFLEVPAELQEAFQKRLQVFVMRSKVKLNHITESSAIVGILGDATAAALTEWFPTLPGAPYELINNAAGTLIRLADAEKTARYQWIMTQALFEQIWPAIGKKFPILTANDWSLSEIHAGIPHITPATQEKFVPQMVNHELIGAVNFKKGCYPGQEIVARTHYLGKQKRRMVLAQIDHADVQSGMEVFTREDPNQPCGMVVNAQANAAGGSDCLIEIKTAYLTDAVVQLSSGEVCRWLAMPYSLPTE